MAKQLDKIVIVDVEATCWENEIAEGMVSDIIEVGICLLDVNTFEVTQNKGILVKPEHSTISQFCTSLTTITPKMVDEEGVSFREACTMLKKEYLTQSRAWASFGAYDQKQFQRQCSLMNIGYPFGPSHINVKTLFALKQKYVSEKGMKEALELLGTPLEGTHHRGVDDSKNIAKILAYVLAN